MLHQSSRSSFITSDDLAADNPCNVTSRILTHLQFAEVKSEPIGAYEPGVEVIGVGIT